MGSYFVIFTWDALRSLGAVTGQTNDFCAKSGAGEAMSVDISFGGWIVPWWGWSTHGDYVYLGIGIKNGISGGIRSGEHGMEEEKKRVWSSSFVGTPEDGSLPFPEHPSKITSKDICEKEEHEAVAKAVLTGKSHKKFPISQPWSKVLALRVAKPAPTNSMELAQTESVGWCSGWQGQGSAFSPDKPLCPPEGGTAHRISFLPCQVDGCSPLGWFLVFFVTMPRSNSKFLETRD